MAPLAVTSVLALLLSGGAALNNGFGRTPIMGFNTYNDVGCSPNESYVTSTIDGLASKGFQALGYKYFQIDCGWQGYDRQSNGSITYDASVFPHGIAPLSKLAISKGFQWSMYTDQGKFACDTKTPLRPGSLGYEAQDAAQLAGWNVAYMKVDNCYIDGSANNAPKDARSDFPSRYQAFQNALANVGIKGMLVCQWGVPYSSSTGLQGPAVWTPPLATSLRVSDDIAQGWANVMRIMNEAIPVNLNGQNGPGHFSDMDLLEVGNPGMTADEQASHFAIWAMFKSALMISTSVSSMTTATANIFGNKGLIAINQDSAGQPVKLVQRYTNDYDVFAGNLANGDQAVLLLDQSNTARTLTIDLSKLGISSATVTNLWTGRQTANAATYSANVKAHGSLPLRLSSINFESFVAPQLTYIEAESGTLSGGAVTQSCSGCSGSKNVGYLGNDGGALMLADIRTSQAAQDVRFDYTNCEIGYLGDQGPNVRGASISVNGGPGQSVLFPLTGYNWDRDVTKSFLVRLSGFNTQGTNTIKIAGLSGSTRYAPDIDRIGVVA
nr:putative alpha-galactosidase d [Quercus suber]